MPAKLVHCRECRALLNTDLSEDSVHIPAFQPLTEMDPADAQPGDDVRPRGEYTLCPHCGNELRVAARSTPARRSPASTATPR